MVISHITNIKVCVQRSEGVNSTCPFAKVVEIVHKLCKFDRTFRHTNDINLRSRITKLINHFVEDIVDMFSGSSVAGNRVLLSITSERSLNSGLLWVSKPACLCHCLLQTSRPSELTHVGQNDGGALIVILGRLLRLDVFNHIDNGALVNSTFSTNNSMREDSNVLSVLIEQNNDSLLQADIARHVDWQVGLFECGAERKKERLETE